ncbi:MAG: DUF4112 domain-containing protein [Gemmatimonadetes bacterium]|nr:DUF4112 domain-containing protein [Gemmatimonadota bacterium]
MDEALAVPGTSLRVGLDSLLGLIPGVGDLAGGVASSWFLVVAARLGAPPAVLARMGLNIGVYALIGVIPFLGDLFDFGWKANRKNLGLLERHLADPLATSRLSRAVVGGALAAVLAVFVMVMVGAILLAALLVRWLVQVL